MKRVRQLILLVGLAALGFWLWTVLFPSPEKLIRQRLTDSARYASFSEREGTIRYANNIRNLVGGFSPDIEIAIDQPGRLQHTFNGRDEILQAAQVARANISSLQVELLDPSIALAADQQSAVVDLTMRVKIPGDKNFIVQEMKFTLKKFKKEWLIIRVETVRTLSQSRREERLLCDSRLHSEGRVTRVPDRLWIFGTRMARPSENTTLPIMIKTTNA